MIVHQWKKEVIGVVLFLPKAAKFIKTVDLDESLSLEWIESDVAKTDLHTIEVLNKKYLCWVKDDPLAKIETYEEWVGCWVLLAGKQHNEESFFSAMVGEENSFDALTSVVITFDEISKKAQQWRDTCPKLFAQL